MRTILIGNIVVEASDERVYGVDVRVYRWLEQWLSEDEARALVFSLSRSRLLQFVIARQPAIEAMPVW